jgi:hypothetical protein
MGPDSLEVSGAAAASNVFPSADEASDCHPILGALVVTQDVPELVDLIIKPR